ncbi:MAG TPA: CdaR family protein [Candidatus Limnocylindria bacterium]|nr:CdaR family protein [Candidatus Limnocylindria bacterium]
MRAVEGVRPAWLRRRIDVRRIVTHDFPLKAVAVVIALLFWVGIMQNATPSVIVDEFDGRIPVDRPDNVPSGYVLRGPLGDVGVTLRGAPGVADRIALSDLKATLDMSSLVLGQAEPQDARVVVTVAKADVEVVAWSPPTVAVRVERLTSRTVVVQSRFANEPPAGTRAGDAEVTPTEVTVTGPESDVARVTAVLGTVRFGDAQIDIESPDIPAIPVDAAGVPIDGLQVEPGVITVKVPVLPIATTRTVPVVFTLRGVVAPGYWVVGAAMDPFAVTVRGEEEVLKTLDRIETLPIDVGDLSATRTLTVRLAVPAGVTLLRPTDITVTVTVQALAGTRAFSSAIVVTGLLPNQTGELDITSVGVLVAGPVPTLANMPPTEVVASVDAAGRGPGTYIVDVAVRVPAGVSAQTVQPTRVTLTIRPRS